jgi:hypothetical protein
MKTRFASLASVLALAAGVGFFGCAENHGSITMRAICVPTDDCMFSSQCDAQYIGFPTLDVGTSDSMWLLVEVANQLPNNADEAAFRTNTNDAIVTSAVVSYERVALPRVTVGSTFLVPADGSAVISVEAIPGRLGAGPILAALAPTAAPVEILAKIRLRGHYVHGGEFETGEFPVAIRICTGCLGVQCGGAPTCPPLSDGQLPLTCAE